jgi:Glycosyl hydrolase family 26
MTPTGTSKPARRANIRSSSLLGGLVVAGVSWAVACSSSDSGAPPAAGGNNAGPGAGAAGATVSGGAPAMAGSAPAGGSAALGGSTASGGAGASAGGATGGTAGGGAGSSAGAAAGGGNAGSTASGGMSTDCGLAPVTPNASQSARKVLCYMKSIYGSHILSGQEENNDDNGMNTIFAATGKYPAIRAFDVNNSKAPTQCVDQWNKGGLCMFGYHMGINGQKYDAATNIGNVLKSGTAENTSFNQDLDRVASYVQPVQDAGGVAIVRLFHEAGNGCSWFWWSKGTSAQWQDLFRYAFTYLTGTKGLKNTLWIAPLCGSPTSAYNPGAKYIDLGGADNYAKMGDFGPMNSIFKATESAFPNLMVALHENGPIPDPDQLKSTGSKWLFFNTWCDPYPSPQWNPVDHLKAVYQSDYVITRDELPSFK